MKDECDFCEFDNSDYPLASYCGRCGRWIKPDGWRMWNAAPSRSFQSSDNVVFDQSMNFTSSQIESDQSDFLLVFGNLIVFSEKGKLIVRKTDNIDDSIQTEIKTEGFPSFPVFVRPFCYSAGSGKVSILRFYYEEKQPVDLDVRTFEDSRIALSDNCAPVGIDTKEFKAAIWGLQRYVLVIQRKQGDHDHYFIPQEGLEEDEQFSSPVVWRGSIVVFLTNRVQIFKLDLHDLPESLAPENQIGKEGEIFSAPVLFEDYLISESYGRAGHRIHKLNLSTYESDSTVLNSEGDLPFSQQRFKYPPCVHENRNRVIVSSFDETELISVDMERWRERTTGPNDNNLYRHSFSIPMNRYLLTFAFSGSDAFMRKVGLLDNRLDIVDSIEKPFKLIYPPVYCESELFVLSEGQLLKFSWK